MVKILYVIDQLDVGGAELQLLELVKRLDRAVFQPFVCSVWAKMAMQDQFHSAGVEILPIHKDTRWDFGFLFRMAEYIRKNSIQIVQTILPTANAWGRAAAILGGAPILIASERAIRSKKAEKGFHMKVDRVLSHWTDAFIVNSQQGAVHWEAQMHRATGTCTVIRNGVDLALFDQPVSASTKLQELRDELGIQPDKTVVGVVARMQLEKDPATFLKAARMVAAQVPKIRFLWVGGGPEMDKARAMAEELGLLDKVVFAGERQDIPVFLKLIDIFLLPSTWEGLPNAIIEAMATAKPVVATNVGGTSELVQDHQTGYLVPAGQPDQMAQKIMVLLENPERARQMGIAGRQFVEQNLSMQQMVTTTQNLYLSLVSQKIAN